MFKSIATEIRRQLRASEKASVEDRIYTAGEKEHLAWKIRQKRGCPVPPPLAAQISGLCKRFSLSYTWPWE